MVQDVSSKNTSTDLWLIFAPDLVFVVHDRDLRCTAGVGRCGPKQRIVQKFGRIIWFLFYFWSGFETLRFFFPVRP